MVQISITYPELTHSNFPDEVSDLVKIRDPYLSEIPLIQKYGNSYANGNISECNKILEDNPSLEETLVNADKLLSLHHDNIAVQKFFKDNIYQYIIDIVKDRGEWVSSIAYDKYNVVYYSETGTLFPYMAIKNVPKNILPTNTNYYIPFAVKGDKGDRGSDGLNLVFKGTYDVLTPYLPNNCVQYNGNLYACKVANTGIKPPIVGSENNYWSTVFYFAIENGYITIDMLNDRLKETIENSSIIIDDSTKVKYKWGCDNGLLYIEEI